MVVLNHMLKFIIKQDKTFSLINKKLNSLESLFSSFKSIIGNLITQLSKLKEEPRPALLANKVKSLKEKNEKLPYFSSMLNESPSLRLKE